MDRDEVRRLLEAVASGGTAVDDAVGALAALPLVGPGFADLGFARVDHHRALRTGDPEVVYGEGKSDDEAVAILRSLRSSGSSRPALVTRAQPSLLAAVRREWPGAAVDESARCAAVGDLPATRGMVAVVSAGTSDGSVAAEAAFVARVFGAAVDRITDVGVSGIHRLIAVQPQLDRADCVVVVAGMEGALPSAVGGLVGVPVVAVPTSVGYGASYGGLAALLAMLTSCAPGVAVCNIDNGFGAGVFSARVARRSAGAKGVA
ncbi:MAG TPA: nickel pincer cofactor biosynthesis protein LarB [Mycobacteriales bacterium]|nr:nickel pincer cofactor biosynthesis protein LarB [Mycobacteriales bacterium]